MMILIYEENYCSFPVRVVVVVLMYLFCLLLFVISGYKAFAPGTAFGAGIGSLLPLAATHIANLNLDSERDEMKHKIDVWVKEAFHQFQDRDEEISNQNKYFLELDSL